MTSSNRKSRPRVDTQDIASRREELLGSVIEVKVAKRDAAVLADCFAELARIQRTYSRFLDDSELSRCNQRLGVWHNITPEFFSLIAKALELNEQTEGNFDITLKSTLDRLGYDKSYSFTPRSMTRREQLSERLKSTRDRVLEKLSGTPRAPIMLDNAKQRALLRRQIDFGGFGKGFALDNVAAVLERAGVTRYYIDAGGDIYAKRGRGEPWVILLEHPDDPERAIGSIELDGKAIAGSASNRRRWKGQHHLLNAKTGLPANEAKCIFVVCDKGIDADAYATAIFTAGFDAGIQLSKKLPVEILFVSQDNKMYKSEGFAAELFE